MGCESRAVTFYSIDAINELPGPAYICDKFGYVKRIVRPETGEVTGRLSTLVKSDQTNVP
jgi:hypothetical protein